MSGSKELEHDDSSGFYFAQEMLNGQKTAAINFDRLMYHPQKGFIIFEYLLCEEKQRYVTPYTSHPRYYWYKNQSKFRYMWNYKECTNGPVTLYLVNYAKKGTLHEDEILLIEVQGMNAKGITKEKKTRMTRKEFGVFFRKLNAECLYSLPQLEKHVANVKNDSEIVSLLEKYMTAGDIKSFKEIETLNPEFAEKFSDFCGSLLEKLVVGYKQSV